MVTTAERVEAPRAKLDRVSPWPLRIVGSATLAFVIVFGWLVLYKHAHFGTRGFDLGIFDQGLWLLSEGKTPFVTLRGLHLFADHTSFLLIPLVPIYWIWADVRLLLILTVLAVAAGGPLVYAIARAENLDRRIAAALGVMYLALPAVHWQIWDAFHPETLAIPLILAAYLAAVRGRPGWTMTILVIVLFAKEDAALIVVPLAIYLGVHLRMRWLAVAGTVVGLAAMIVAFGWVLPHWSPTGELIYTGRYAAFGESIPDIVWGLLTSPAAVAGAALDGRALLYLAGLLVPFLVAVLAPEILLVAGPVLLANLLSRHTYQAELMYHYTAYLIPIVAIAGTVGARRLLRWSRAWSAWRRRAAAITALVAALVGSVVGGPWGLGDRNPWAGRVARTELAAAALAVIPPDAAVAADSQIVTHLAHRETIYVLPNPVVPTNWSAGGAAPPAADSFDWLVIRSDNRGKNPVFLETLAELISSGSFVPVVENDELTVLRRVRDAPSPDG